MRVIAVFAVALALAAAGCGGSSSSAPTTAQKPKLTDLTNIDQLETQFTAHADVPRLVLIVSPT
jgi:hypothetical protein